MTAVEKPQLITVEEYLEGEPHAELRHEFIAGVVYAMAGTSLDHNLIAGNVLTALRQHLAGKHCRVFMSDVKVRLKIADDDIFYYPDVMVGCDPRDTEKFYLRHPKIIVEVLSETTERTDRREKLLSYMRIDSLETYVLVAQDKAEVTVLQRGKNWQAEIFKGRTQSIHLDSIAFTLPLSAIYEGVAI